MCAPKVQDFLYRECGLKGLSGVSNDMRELEASSDPRAAFAIAYFVYRIGLNAGMLAAALQGLDAFVFTAGIGENSASIRGRISEKLAWLGVALDPAQNAAPAGRISRPDSRIPVYVIPTDEELMIAQHTLALLMSQPSSSTKHERVSCPFRCFPRPASRSRARRDSSSELPMINRSPGAAPRRFARWAPTSPSPI
jgi:acetate kinase